MIVTSSDIFTPSLGEGKDPPVERRRDDTPPPPRFFFFESFLMFFIINLRFVPVYIPLTFLYTPNFKFLEITLVTSNKTDILLRGGDKIIPRHSIHLFHTTGSSLSIIKTIDWSHTWKCEYNKVSTCTPAQNKIPVCDSIQGWEKKGEATRVRKTKIELKDFVFKHRPGKKRKQEI